MAAKRVDWRRVKSRRAYRIDEAALLLGVCRGTVRNWMKSGLTAATKTRPFLIRGDDLKSFLRDRAQQAKKPCPPGHFYCLRCREPKPPSNPITFVADNMVFGTLKAPCAACGAQMNRKARRDYIHEILPDRTVQFP